jgi:hypothetical protein
MDIQLSLTLYDYSLGDSFPDIELACMETVQRAFHFLQQQPMFNWHKSHNFCEARAEAASLLLAAAGIYHAKCWVFGAAFLRKGYVGGLKNNWNYHVSVAVPTVNVNELAWMVLDPAMADEPQALYEWASNITDYPHSYHFVKDPQLYIFPAGSVVHDKWHKRHPRNFRWAMQGLAGVNALTPTGRAQLAFCKRRIDAVTRQFVQVRNIFNIEV